MPRASWTQNNFNAGEWSPLTYGRADLQKYKNSLALCKNYIPTAQGGLTRRPGTKYVAEVKSSSAKVRLQSFEFSITQAYVLEFGNQYVRFYTNGGQLLSGGSPYEVSTPYTTADLDGLSFVQSADVLYIAHPSYAPRTLSRLGATSWSLATISFQDGPYLILNTAATTLTSSATTGSATVTASAVTGINNDTGFQTTDVGRVIRLKVGTNWAWGTITARASTTSITVNWSTTVGGTTASNLWRLGVWNSTNGYPAAITFHQDRLWLAGPTQYPNRVDASVSGDYTNFAPTDATGTVADSNALSFNLASAKMNTINWMVSDEWGLLVGTASNEWVVAANTIQVALTPTNINAKQVTSYGSNTVRPIRMGKSTLFLQRTGRKLREMSYQFVVNTFQAPDISMLSEHLTASGIFQLAAQLAPQPVLWMVRNDGTLVSMSYDKDQEISGWAQHDLGGYSDSAQTQTAIVESIAVIPSQDVTRDDLWLSVKRYINGATFRSVELMQKYWEDGDQQIHAFYADCGATYDGVSTATISGLTWLKGQTVTVLADGAVHPDCVVNSSGVITLDRSVTHANVGLKYTSEAQTMRIEAGGGDGSAQGKLKRIHRAVFRMFQTVGMTVKAGTQDGYPEPFRSSADLMDNPVALYTGDRRWAWDGTYDLEGQVYFAQTDPLPSNILMVVAQLDTQDGG